MKRNTRLSVSKFCILNWVPELIDLDLQANDPDAPRSSLIDSKRLVVLERKLNTALELNRGHAVYKKELDELMTSDLWFLSKLTANLNELTKEMRTTDYSIILHSTYGDALIKTFI